jgi:hypothetical protein
MAPLICSGGISTPGTGWQHVQGRAALWKNRDWTRAAVAARLGPLTEEIMKRYMVNRNVVACAKHESVRHQIHDERRSEEQKLSRLRTLLERKLQAALVRHGENQAA